MANLNLLPQPASFPPGVAATDTEAKNAYILRYGAAVADAVATGSVTHPVNTDLTDFPDGLGTYSKGLLQASAAIVDPATFKQFLIACGIKPGVGLGDFENPAIVVPGPAKLNGPRGAFAGQLTGQDSAAFSIPAAPALDSPEYAIELVENYWASLLRDVAFTDYPTNATAIAAAAEIDSLRLAHPGAYKGPLDTNGHVTPQVLFRGGFNAMPQWFPGELAGPYISQFAITPTALGALSVTQKVKTLSAGVDYMTDLGEWAKIQNGGAPSASATFEDEPLFMYCGRVLGSYTRVDELYQAYLVAYLVATTLGVGPNPGSPYVGLMKEKAFGTFGGPDISSTLGGVARAAINAVWYQKWRVHLRHRPEAGGGIAQLLKNGTLNAADAAMLGNFSIVLNSRAVGLSAARNGGSVLLSQAFPEGSPTHPAYPTGHGTVAGACITVLKFFLNGGQTITNPLVPSCDGRTLEPYNGTGMLTVDGELNKLAHNISFGHGIHAGIHWRSDTDWSIALGEAVAIGYLQDQIWTYAEKVDISIRKIDGSTHNFKNF